MISIEVFQLFPYKKEAVIVKRVISCLVGTILLLSSISFSSLATNGGIQTCASLCGDCNRGEMVQTSIERSSWYSVGYIPCSYNKPNYNDTIKRRTITTVYECTYCHLGESNTHYEEEVVHDHP